MSAMKEVAELQTAYQSLARQKRLTKKAMCELCIPFRDKYGLTDWQVLRIARNEMELAEMANLLEKDGGETR